jgi:glycosyltransferase 2 family protein
LSRALHWRLAAGGVLALGLLALFLRGLDWGKLGEAWRTADRSLLVAAALSALLTYAFRAWRWGYLLAPLARVRFPRLFSATVVGFFTGLVIPRAGEIVRPYLVARDHELKVSAAFASIILERLIDLVTVLVLLTVYLYVLPAPAGQKSGPLMDTLKRGGAVVGVLSLVLLAVLALFHVHAERAMAVVDRVLAFLPAWLGTPLGAMARSFAEGLAVLQAPAGHLLAVLAQSFLVWFSIGGSIHFTNRAFGLDLPYHATFLIIAFLTVGVAIPTPGMVGGFHWFYRLALTQVYGVADEAAVAAAVACHLLSNLPVLLFGFVFLGREGLTFSKVAEMAEKNGSAGRGRVSAEGS